LSVTSSEPAEVIVTQLGECAVDHSSRIALSSSGLVTAAGDAVVFFDTRTGEEHTLLSAVCDSLYFVAWNWFVTLSLR